VAHDDEDNKVSADVRQLQNRINTALRDSAADRAQSRFSPFIDDQESDFARNLMRAASAGGLEGVWAALDEFDRLAATEDLESMRYALLVFLTHHPDVAKLGLRIPSLEERSLWKTLPSTGRRHD
jgi:hypothetical protein